MILAHASPRLEHLLGGRGDRAASDLVGDVVAYSGRQLMHPGDVVTASVEPLHEPANPWTERRLRGRSQEQPERCEPGMVGDHPAQISGVHLARRDDRGLDRARIDPDQLDSIRVLVVETDLRLGAVDLGLPCLHDLTRTGVRREPQLEQAIWNRLVVAVGGRMRDQQMHAVTH